MRGLRQAFVRNPITASVLGENLIFFGDYHYFKGLKELVGHVRKLAPYSIKKGPKVVASLATPESTIKCRSLQNISSIKYAH